MPVYNNFNLATQGRNGQTPNVTTNYYSGLNRPNPVGNQLGNQSGPAGPNLIGTRSPTTPTHTGTSTANTPNVTTTDRSAWDRRYLERENERIRQVNINGRRSWAGEDASGFMETPEYTAENFKYGGKLDDDDPLVAQFKRQFGEHQFVDENGNPMQSRNSSGEVASGYRIVSPDDPIYYGLANDEYLQDSSRILRLPDGRLLIEDANYNGGAVAGAQRAQETRSREFTQRAALTAALMVAGGVAGGYLGGVYGAAGEVGAGAELLGGTGGVTQYATTQGLLAGAEGAGAGTGVGVGTASQVGVPNAAAELAAGTGAGTPPPGFNFGPLTGPAGYEGAGAAAAAGGGGAASSSLPFGLTGRDLATAASGVYNVINSRNVRNDANAAADRADPYGPRRATAGEALDNFMRDPNYIYQRPGYLARQSQGEQSINRAAAGKGYFRSPNILFDLSKFNSGLAAQEFDAEYKRLAEMAGVGINPGTAATIQANGSQASTNMRSAGITQAGSVFFDWLSRQG